VPFCRITNIRFIITSIRKTIYYIFELQFNYYTVSAGNVLNYAYERHGDKMREWIKVISFLIAGSFFLYVIGSLIPYYVNTKENNNDKLVIYTQHPVEFVTPIVREFEARTDIEVEVVRAGSGQLLDWIEEDRENPKADILWGGSYYTMKPHAELFAAYQTENEPYVRSEFKNTEGNLIRFTDVPSVIMVNTDLLGNETIEGYEDLLKPEFYGKIAFADPNISSSSLEQLINMLYACRDEDEWGWKYVEALCRQLDGKLLTSSSAVYNGVANGEFVAGLTFEEAVAGSMDDGKHVAIVYMKEGVISTPDGVYLIQNAPHRDEAVEFLNFVTGYDAQYMITAQLNRRSVRVDVPATDKLPAKDTLPMLQPDSAEIESHRNEWLAQFNQIWKECAHE
jgi:iron(III) transport system substrate-binding protein